MNSTSEKRKTQIDFDRLKLDPPLESGVLGKATKGLTGGYNSGNRANTKQGSLKTRKSSLSAEGMTERRDTQSGTLTRKDSFSSLALVKSFIGSSVEDKLHEGCYVVFEYMAYSLYYVAGNPCLDKIRLAAIVGQQAKNAASCTHTAAPNLDILGH
ncbi:uncharacterized protein BDZ99DRAFT_479591 [Mytilinidion resinicola]|uniref:Uncharacterized protein n=1 Tax=Mytilinidion resinicola TaxID=574789 RepID=A0A6A6YCT0_9PEZI|nr:uncharacterized protein BDZ99DRAFT_479591 [Mytilinidion resinicola]KAF2806323.1 hypothetical protein BDZ99DRAFT_479591 [Mytilinidion resinicola]